MGDKRKRSPNWLFSEKHLLLDVVQKHFSVVENKKTDSVTMKQKNMEWIIMSDEYNSQTMHVHRTSENLKAQWESMKKAVKKESSKLKMHLFQTGGGPPKPKPEDPFHNRILGLIEPSVVGLHNPFDNDAQDSNTLSQSTEVQESLEEVAHVKVIETEPPVPDYTPIPGLHLSGSLTEVKEPSTFLTAAREPSDFLGVVKESSNLLTAAKELHGLESKFIKVGSTVPDCTSVLDTAAKKNSDWGNYTPHLLKSPVTNNLRVEKKNTETKKGISKRRPVLPTSSLDLLYNKKVEAITVQRGHADDERREANSLYKINMQIKEEELNIKREELKQNKIKTRLLLLELRRKKKH